MNAAPLLEVRDLRVSFPSRGGRTELVRGVTFTVEPGQRLGIFGESGSGKTLTALSVLRLLPRSARATGQILFDGQDLLALDERGMTQVRGAKVAMVHQNPMTALNPLRRIGDQLVQAVRVHATVDRATARSRAIALLDEVGVHDASARIDSYPHEFSGGMRQRVAIAIALASDPKLIIADEATTALDVTTQNLIIALLRNVAERRGSAVIFVTHDLAVASTFCTDVQVMYAGRIVERAPADSFYASQLHPYSAALVGSICDVDLDPEVPIPSIAGQPPTSGRFPEGCSFHPRCPVALSICDVRTPTPLTIDRTTVECHLFSREPETRVAEVQ